MTEELPPPTLPRGCHEKTLEHFDRAFAIVRDEFMGSLSAIERMMLQPLLVTAEVKARQQLAEVEPADLDATLLSLANMLLQLRSDDADGAEDAPRIAVGVGELELLRRKDAWCREHHTTPPAELKP